MVLKKSEEAILRLLNQGDFFMSPSNIAFNIDYDRDYVGDLCSDLEDRGYVEMAGKSTSPKYRITKAGRDYLE
jgi:predicted transcriptional regulator